MGEYNEKINILKQLVTEKQALIEEGKRNILKLQEEVRQFNEEIDHLEINKPKIKIKTKLKDKVSQMKNLVPIFNKLKEDTLTQGRKISQTQEYQKVSESFETIKKETKELNLYDILNKATQDTAQAGQALRRVISNKKIDKKIGDIIENGLISEVIKKTKPENKHDYFLEWANHKSINTHLHSNELYDNYLEYLSKKYSHKKIENIAYSKDSGHFMRALQKFNSSEATE